MPIAPNTTFVSGAILTAAQQNAFGFGVVAIGTSTTASGAVSVETLGVTSSSFTAIANRYYKVTYCEPSIGYGTGTTVYVDSRIRITSIAGAIQQQSPMFMNSMLRGNITVSIVKTLSAGATVFVGTFQPQGGGTASALRSADFIAYIVVEDIGPA